MAAALTERERSDAVLFSISEGLAVLDAQGRVVRINPAICQMLQLTTGDADLPCDPAEIGAVAQLLNPSKGEIVGPYEMEIEIGHRRATVRANVSPVESPAGGRVLVVRDTTQERQAAEARSLFISQVAHELRTPLQHILSFLSLAGDTAEQDEELAHLLSHIEGETYHLARLVDDLTELSRLEAGRFAVHLERVRMDVWVRQATARLAPRAQMREHLLLLDELPEPVWCLTDPLRVEQVLTNLVENALKYVPTASTVRVRLECAPDSAIVRVIDQGPGIAPEELDSIFGAFYQIDKQASLRSGMGLGLYISREIVRALHGDIWVESQVGLGSAFSFRLPRLPGPAESSA
jgi:two-component system sensor histidine kinase ResE